MADSTSAKRRALCRGAMFGWNTAECLRWQTCAAARSLARTGIAPACWTKNRMSLTISCLPPLIADKITDKDHLAIQGGSNGGLLMGAAFTQRPDLFRAVVCQVPLLDMLSYQNFQIAKIWIPEYGNAEDPKEFEWLKAYTP